MLLQKIISDVEQDIEKRLEELNSKANVTVEINNLGDEEKGFLALPLGFKLASELGKSPQDALKDFSQGFEFENDYITDSKIESGYLNLFLDEESYAKDLVSEIKHKTTLDKNNGLAVIDESSPNVAKPMHIGHLRNTLLSASLNEVLERTGYDVIADNHLGDWGGQFGNLMYAFKQWGSEEELKENPIDHLLELYQKFGQLEAKLEDEEKEALRDKGREWFSRLEAGEKEAQGLWGQFREVSVERFEETYDILDIEFDEWIGEAYYVQEGYTTKIVQMALDQGIAKKKEDGSVVVEVGEPDPETGEQSELVILKSDGSTLYSTRDLATILYRNERWNPEHMMYVVGSEQDKYFEEIFEVADRLGFDHNFVHVSYGMISLPEGSMSTRKGTVVTARKVIEEATTKAEELVSENNPDLDEKDKLETAERIGLAALRFETLKYSRKRDFEFDKDAALDFNGETGPYLLYSLTRAKKIIRDSNTETYKLEPENLSSEELRLIGTLSKLPLKLEESQEKYDPSVIANYGYELAKDFNNFYHSCPVLDAEKEIRKQRLSLTNAYIQVMGEVLDILCIKKVDLM